MRPPIFSPLFARRIVLPVLLLLPPTSVVLAEKVAEPKVGWVTAYWAGWARISPQDVPGKATRICASSRPLPTPAEDANLPWVGTTAAVRAAIAEAHRNGVKVLLCVGGGGEGSEFVASTADAAVRATLIKNILASDEAIQIRRHRHGLGGVAGQECRVRGTAQGASGGTGQNYAASAAHRGRRQLDVQPHDRANPAPIWTK